MLQQTTLGRTGLKVSRLGYGSMGLRGPRTWGVRVVDDASAEHFLHLVLDSGINFIDTSPDYGVSEERIGRYLSSRRDEFVLATKCGCVYTQQEDHLEIDHHWDPDVIRGNLETSLRRLRNWYGPSRFPAIQENSATTPSPQGTRSSRPDPVSWRVRPVWALHR